MSFRKSPGRVLYVDFNPDFHLNLMLPAPKSGAFFYINILTMIELNFYKIRTTINILPKAQGGNDESQLRYDQIIQTISQRSDIEFTYPTILTVEETNPSDLLAHNGQKVLIYVMIFALNKNNASWTANSLKLELGNMRLSKRILDINPNAAIWSGGSQNNISCEAAYFDLRAKKRKLK